MKSTLLFVLAVGSLFVVLSDSALAKSPRITGSIAIKENATAAEKLNLNKVREQDAKSAALKAYPGKVVKAELDEEDGFLVWEVDIVSRDGVKHEVLVDAGNVKVLRNERDND